MKTASLTFIAIALGSLPSHAATSVLTVSGTVETVTAGSPALVGAPYQLQLRFPTQLPATFQNSTSAGFRDVVESMALTVGAETFLLTYLSVDVTYPAGQNTLFQFIFSDSPNTLGSDIHLGSFTISNSMTPPADPTHLPGSLGDWDLASGDYYLQFAHVIDPMGSGVGALAFSSSHYSSLTLTSVPESGAAVSLGALAMVFQTRRSRSRSQAGISQIKGAARKPG